MEHVLEFNDFVQEVLLRVWVRRRTFRGSTQRQLLAWIRRIATSILVDCIRHEAIRQRARRRPLVSDLETDPIADPAVHVPHRDEVRVALSKLKPDEREVLEHHYLSGRTFRDIASRLDKPYDVITRLHQKGLARLQRDEQVYQFDTRRTT